MTRFYLAYQDFYQVMLTLFIFLLGLVLCLLLSNRDRKSLRLIGLLYLWHTAFSIFYWFSTLKSSADATGYYLKSFNPRLEISPGTRFTEYFTYIITKLLDSNYLNTTLVFNIFGSMGLIFFYKALSDKFKYLPWYWVFILFIPSMSYWSGAVGKDSLLFFAICLMLYSITTEKRRLIVFPILFLIVFMIRPHIALAITASFLLYFILKARVNILVKSMLLPIILIGFSYSLKFVEGYIGLEDASLDSVDNYFDSREGANMNGGGAIDSSSMSIPMKLFSYGFRPLPYEAHSFVALISSIENLLMLIVFLYIIVTSKFKFNTWFKGVNLWLSSYTFMTAIMLSYGLSNLGIAARQKWMFFPILIYLFISMYSEHRAQKGTYSNEVSHTS